MSILLTPDTPPIDPALDPDRPLGRLERRFVDEYLVDFKAQPASVRAGYKYNAAIGTRLLKRPNVAKEIMRRCLDMQVRLQIDANDVRQGVARIATDPRPPPLGPTVSERLTAWRDLGKMLGMYLERHHHTGTLTLEDLLLASEAKRNAEQPRTN